VTAALGAEEEQLDQIPNQVDLSPFSPPAPSVRSSLWPEERPLMLFAGRLEYEKGVQTALDAMSEIDRHSPGAGLIVAGDGTYRSTLEGQARKLGIAHMVRFVGFVDEARLRSLYRSVDLAIVPSLYEPFGLVALEAMASETPVVVADAGGLREFVEHEVSGLRFETGNPQALADAVTRVLHDPALGKRLAREARSALEARGSWTTAAVRTAETYRRAVEGATEAKPLPLRVVRDV
jgi:glycogen(starch) synthase